MSQENVEVVRRTLDAFNRDGVEATLQYLDPEVEWLAPPEWLEQPVYHGHDGIRKVASTWTETFREYRLDADEFIDVGDQVVALVYQRGLIEGSEDPVEQRIGYVWTVRGGKGVRVQVHFSWEAALRDAGLG
jgi:ketosteroid isomerase-like protein